MKDKRIVVEFNVPWNTDSIDAAVSFLQKAIRDYREDAAHSHGGEYTPERLALCGYLKEVISARLLGADDAILVVNNVIAKKEDEE